MNTDLSSNYLGLKLANPIVISACPLTGELDVLRQLEDFGAAAAVLPSLFEEQIDGKPPNVQARAGPGVASLMENAAHFHELKEYNRGPDSYLKHLASAKRAVSIPLIGSLNVTALGEWVHYARRIEEAGADALELNVYFLVADFDTTSREIESRYIELVAAVRNEITIPLAVKIGPYFTALPNVARRLVEAGADGLVLFNRFLQPDIDVNVLRVLPRLSLSTPEEMREALRWIALLHGRLNASLAATTGVHFADDAIRFVLAGADVVMVASTLYRHGVEVLRTLVDGVRDWLEAKDYSSLEQAKGILSHRRSSDPSAFERANYTTAISSYAAGDGAWRT
ncbi:MAG: dihydroorotate dehydrogenase-like protein [Pirellulales bacterium]